MTDKLTVHLFGGKTKADNAAVNLLRELAVKGIDLADINPAGINLKRRPTSAAESGASGQSATSASIDT